MTNEEIKQLEQEIENTKQAYRVVIHEAFRHAWKTIVYAIHLHKTCRKIIHDLTHKNDFIYIDMDGAMYAGIGLLVAELLALVIYFT